MRGIFVCHYRDIWSAARVSQERPDASYRLLAIDFLPAAAVNAALRSLSASMATGEIVALAHGSGLFSAPIYGFWQRPCTAHAAVAYMRWHAQCAGGARPAVSIVHGMSQTRAALRQLMQTGHVGKLVVKAQQTEVQRDTQHGQILTSMLTQMLQAQLINLLTCMAAARFALILK